MSTKLESIAIQTYLMASRVWQIGAMDRLPYKLTGARLMVLHTIKEREPISTAGIAEAERVASPTISRMVGDLEEHGLVTRKRNPKDGRGSFLKLTKKGRTACGKASVLVCGPLLKRLDTLTAQERKVVLHSVSMLNRLCVDTPKAGRVLQDLAEGA